jgi:hypothetical protein
LAPSLGRCEITRRELGEAALGAILSISTRQKAWSASSGAARLEGVTRWRADFPALDQTVNGYPLAYLDSAATTQRPAAVLAALLNYYRHDNANPGATLHVLARRAHEQYEGARRALAAFINAADPAEVVWVRGTTEGINLVASAWARPRLRPGDELLLTVAEHASNLLRHSGLAPTWTAVGGAASAGLFIRVGGTLSGRNPPAPGHTRNRHPRRRSRRTAALEALRS